MNFLGSDSGAKLMWGRGGHFSGSAEEGEKSVSDESVSPPSFLSSRAPFLPGCLSNLVASSLL